MSSTVTTSTVSTVAAMAFYGSFALLLAATLLFMLVKKEVLTTSDSPVAKTLRRSLNIVLIPLLLAFGLIAIVNLIDVIA